MSSSIDSSLMFWRKKNVKFIYYWNLNWSKLPHVMNMMKHLEDSSKSHINSRVSSRARQYVDFDRHMLPFKSHKHQHSCEDSLNLEFKCSFHSAMLPLTNHDSINSLCSQIRPSTHNFFLSLNFWFPIQNHLKRHKKISVRINFIWNTK